MSYAPQRSLAGDLNEGLTDGGHKKVVRDRGGNIDPATYAARADLHDTWHGVHEKQFKHRPDVGVVRTPNYVPTPLPLLGM